jgi:hypothetical protein
MYWVNIEGGMQYAIQYIERNGLEQQVARVKRHRNSTSLLVYEQASNSFAPRRKELIGRR